MVPEREKKSLEPKREKEDIPIVPENKTDPEKQAVESFPEKEKKEDPEGLEFKFKISKDIHGYNYTQSYIFSLHHSIYTCEIHQSIFRS